MSVIMESRLGDKIVFVIGDVRLCEFGIEFTWKNSREFKVGELVTYVDAHKDPRCTQDYLSWYIKFETDDHKIYAATQLYFVTLDEWKEIGLYWNVCSDGPVKSFP